jgi:hypothetical protein
MDLLQTKCEAAHAVEDLVRGLDPLNGVPPSLCAST